MTNHPLHDLHKEERLMRSWLLGSGPEADNARDAFARCMRAKDVHALSIIDKRSQPAPPPPHPQAPAVVVRKGFSRWQMLGGMAVTSFMTLAFGGLNYSFILDQAAHGAVEEQVLTDAFFYKDRSKKDYESKLGLTSLTECHRWVEEKYRANGDIGQIKGNHVCAMGREVYADGRVRYTRGTSR